MEAMEWTQFTVNGNVAPGVVAMWPDNEPGLMVIIKPGSYSWGERVRRWFKFGPEPGY
jgi:hypothetical protein